MDQSNPVENGLPIKEKPEPRKKHANRKEKQVHYPKDSLFTSSSGFANYRGLFNLAMIILVISHSRLALENIIKYGILVDPIAWITFFLKDPYHWPCTCLFLVSNVFPLACLGVERLMSKNLLCDKIGVTLQAINLIFVLVFPACVVLQVGPNPIAAVFTLAIYTSIFLKLVSYVAVNKWCRDAVKSHVPVDLALQTHDHFGQENFVTQDGQGDVAPQCSDKSELSSDDEEKSEEGSSPKTSTTAKDETDIINHDDTFNDGQTGIRKRAAGQIQNEKNGEVVTVRRESCAPDSVYSYKDEKDLKILFGRKPAEYPNNLTLKDLYYFLLVPTFCYELNFPRTQRIRKLFLFKRVMEIIFLLQLMLGLIQQWIIPIISNAMDPLSSMDYPRMFERLLKLSIPNHLIWLIFFYWLFHSVFNAQAEIMRFADRNFYNDWWNAETINEFWQSWNIPVHRWCSRHLYFPLLDIGVSKMQAAVVVFLVSAFFHEYMLSVPLHMFRLWAFSGMLMQVPLAFLVSKYLRGGQWGNILVWLSLILGQPICIFMYFHDYYVMNKGNLSSTSKFLHSANTMTSGGPFYNYIHSLPHAPGTPLYKYFW